MTQNGQGEEPSPRPAREGIVLPSDGSAPLLPDIPPDHTTPAGGQSWDQPWGPGRPPQSPQGQGQGQGEDHGEGQGWPGPAQDGRAPAPAWGAPSDSASGWGGDQGPGYGAQGAGGYGAQPHDQAPQYGTQNADTQSQWGAPPAASGEGGHLPPQANAPAPPTQQSADTSGLSPQGPTPPPQGTEGYGAHGGYAPSSDFSSQSAPHGSGRHGAPQGPGGPTAQQANGGYEGSQAPAAYGTPQAPHGQAAPLPPAEHSAPQMPGGPQAQSGHAAQGAGPAPLPPAEHAAQPQSQATAPGRHSAPLPLASGADEGATQYLPPVASGAAGAPGDEGATQYIPPVSPGALPPEAPAPSAAEATRFLGRVRQGGPGPMPAAGATAAAAGAGPMPTAADPDAQATQYIPPVPAQPGGAGAAYGIRPGGPGDRQPPAEFDNLFRESSGPDATQQLPQFDPQAAPGGRAARRERGAADSGRGNGGSSRGRIPLIAAVGVGIAVLGIGAGAMLSGGGDDGGDENKTAAATAPTEKESPSASADPAKAQAVALDKLLADSNDSRDAVIKAVANVRACTNLGQAATDLRNAAEQRNGLVTRLAGLSVDKLPNHTQLTAALNSAWKASASADTHYAAWADQVAAKKGCPKGKARTTPQTRAGNRESGTATTEKAKAAPLWNAIAQTYGLTERQPTQL
ncbi:hypothetical protein [Streptomyces vastus]|uniref:Uncharacterized protein n=1 Tax=Streptomyces vastus TaxID=285451 RepID=A0ABN3RGF3_9ACTN